MKRIFATALLLLLFPASGSSQQDQTPSFSTLSSAVEYIVRCIVDKTPETFSKGFIDPRSGTLMHTNVFNELARINKATPLVDLYAKRQFPTDDVTFLLGGHAKELGFINITFIKKNGLWYLADAYFCR